MSGLATRRRRSDIAVPPECRELVQRGALVAVNHSGGKDSQCMTILLSRLVPREQLLVVHAPLGEVEWPDTLALIEATIPDGVPLILAPVTSGKSLLQSIEERGQFPSASVRWCTSSTKRGPIERELRHYLRSHPRFAGRLVNAMGLRADESAARARKTPWKRSDRNSRAGRSWFDWLPIFDLSTDDVFRIIRDAGQSPHWAYAAGMSRLSCSFCILASRVRPAPGRRAPPRSLPKVHGARTAHRPHAIPHAHTASTVDRRSGRARRNRISPLRRRSRRP